MQHNSPRYGDDVESGASSNEIPVSAIQRVYLPRRTLRSWKIYLFIAPFLVCFPIILLLLLIMRVHLDSQVPIPNDVIMGIIITIPFVAVAVLILATVNAIALIAGLARHQFNGVWKVFASTSLVISSLPLLYIGYSIIFS